MNDNDLIESYDRDGFVFLPGFLSPENIRTILDHLDRYIAEVVPTMPQEHVFYEDREDPTTLKQLQQMANYDPWFHDLFTTGPIRELAETLLRGPVVPRNMQYFNKPPGVGQPTPPHQDGYYFMLEPCEALTMWIALEEVDEETGCVRYLPGSHKDGMREHGRTQTLGFSQGILGYPRPEDSAAERAFPASPGDMLAHHALTIHRADGNSSATRSRRALGFIYYSERAREDVAAHEAYQEKLAKDLAAAGKI